MAAFWASGGVRPREWRTSGCRRSPSRYPPPPPPPGELSCGRRWSGRGLSGRACRTAVDAVGKDGNGRVRGFRYWWRGRIVRAGKGWWGHLRRGRCRPSGGSFPWAVVPMGMGEGSLRSFGTRRTRWALVVMSVGKAARSPQGGMFHEGGDLGRGVGDGELVAFEGPGGVDRR